MLKSVFWLCDIYIYIMLEVKERIGEEKKWKRALGSKMKNWCRKRC